MRIAKRLIPVILVLLGILLLVVWLSALGQEQHVPKAVKEPQAKTQVPIVISPLRVCLDAGHGGSDPGTSDTNGQRLEKDDTLALALAVYKRLQELRVDVFLTRSDDSYPTLDERCAMANDDGATLFVSLHRNSGGGAGVEVWISANPAPESEYFGKIVLEALDNCGIQRNRGVRRGTPGNASGDFILNSQTNMPSCVIEMGFMDNETDNELFDEHLEDYADVIADSIAAMNGES